MRDTPVQELVRELPDGEELVTEILPPRSRADSRERGIEARGVNFDELEERRES